MVPSVHALVLAFLMLAGPTVRPPERPARGAVEAKLRAYKPDPGPWRALGPGTDQALIEIAGDGKAELLLRARAVSTLSYFPTPATRKFLDSTIDGKTSSSDPGDRLLLAKAAVALGWLGGTQVPERLAPLLESEDPDVRLDAAVGLGLTRLPSAADSLRKRLDVEPVARVRAQISRQIQVIDDAVAAATVGRKK
jgi:HEAT repeat protein